MGKQIEMKLPTWGGRRKGAGRPRAGRKCVEHSRRVKVAARLPVHVTVRIADGLPTLRSRRAFGAVGRSIWRAQGRFGMRIVHFSVQHSHAHFVVEGVDERQLGRAMKGLGVRIARGLNRLTLHRGRVIGDRYHARALRTPNEVRAAVNYVLRNHEHHTGLISWDEFSSEGQPQIAARPRSWLLTHAPPPT